MQHVEFKEYVPFDDLHINEDQQEITSLKSLLASSQEDYSLALLKKVNRSHRHWNIAGNIRACDSLGTESCSQSCSRFSRWRTCRASC
jgi:hypothetical protein